MKDKEFSETVTREYDNGVETEKTVGKDGENKWESVEVRSKDEDVAPIYKEQIDEDGRRKGSAEIYGGEDDLGDEDKAWLEVLWRSPSDSDERYHRAVQAYKKEKGLPQGEESDEEIKEVFGLDDNEQCVDYPTKEGLKYLKKAIERPVKKKDEEVEEVEEEEEEYGE